MKKFFTLGLSLIFLSASAQTQITNGGFETWDNPTATNAEPTSFNSNKTGSSTAQIGPQTCFRDASVVHGGTYSVRVESVQVPIIGTIVNGNVTTGVVNAPTTNKADGYIATVKYNDANDIRRMPFTARPDSLVGWYRYTQGGAAERGKVVAYLHVGNYYDPEAATTYHPDSSANKIASALFLTPVANVATWTRFSIPFTYVDGRTPSYIMINITSSNDQLTNVAGSKLWVDDLAVASASSTGINNAMVQQQIAKVYCYDKMVYVDFAFRSEEMSTISIYDVTGKLVATQKISNNKLNTINVFGLNSGMYLYQITGASFQKAGKFFVE
ncbi:MAG: PCMD domain-containing protein [Bacteroidetes bacterium]|nr:PCMD domain-containing protein [Bacteroidota bacterium]